MDTMATPTDDNIIDLRGEPDWTEFDAPALVGNSLRFVSGDPQGERFRVSYYLDADRHLKARVWFGPETEGPPGHAHGGSIAAVLDEVLGLSAWAAGHAIVVANLNVSFRNLLPLKTVVNVDTEVASVNGRKVLVKGRVCSGSAIYAEAECLCIVIRTPKTTDEMSQDVNR
jgi:acyl-coenzyme A thioesterase PaaI-like protein